VIRRAGFSGSHAQLAIYFAWARPRKWAEGEHSFLLVKAGTKVAMKDNMRQKRHGDGKRATWRKPEHCAWLRSCDELKPSGAPKRNSPSNAHS